MSNKTKRFIASDRCGNSIWWTVKQWESNPNREGTSLIRSGMSVLEPGDTVKKGRDFFNKTQVD